MDGAIRRLSWGGPVARPILHSCYHFRPMNVSKLMALAAAGCLVGVAGCGSSSPAPSSSGGSTPPSTSTGAAGATGGNQDVGVFTVSFSMTGYYHLSGSGEVAAGNGNTCAEMAANGNGPDGGNEWYTPFPASVTTGGHKITELQGSVGVDTFRKTPSTSTVTDKVNNSSYITVDNNTFDAFGEGASGTVTVKGDASGSFVFADAPGSASTPSGQMATVSGTVTWSCKDVPPSQAPPTTGG